MWSHGRESKGGRPWLNMISDAKCAARQRQSLEQWTISFNAIHIVTVVKYLWREFGQPIQSISRDRDGDTNESACG
jgi:hypothetical protein